MSTLYYEDIIEFLEKIEKEMEHWPFRSPGQSGQFGKFLKKNKLLFKELSRCIEISIRDHNHKDLAEL